MATQNPLKQATAAILIQLLIHQIVNKILAKLIYKYIETFPQHNPNDMKTLLNQQICLVQASVKVE